MCQGIALIRSELPEELIERHDLARRLHLRARQPEYRFLFDDPDPRLPIRRHGQTQIARWGNRRGRSRYLPREDWTWKEAIEKGRWAHLETEEVVIPATHGLDQRGVWYQITNGIRGLLVPDERGKAIVFVICEPPTNFWRNMTGADRMPVFVDQRF